MLDFFTQEMMVFNFYSGGFILIDYIILIILEQTFLNKQDKMTSFVKKCETKKEESECLVKKSESSKEIINEVKKGWNHDKDIQNLSEDEVKILHREVFNSSLNTAVDILTKRGEQPNADLLKKITGETLEEKIDLLKEHLNQ